mmetsp:Transcript_12369/g.29444  ORF Transcript_12369/g.29444 Transcript_12369/m.29444 type:complete len:83 (-) Transcript_12369:52-300(-)
MLRLRSFPGSAAWPPASEVREGCRRLKQSMPSCTAPRGREGRNGNDGNCMSLSRRSLKAPIALGTDDAMDLQIVMKKAMRHL